MVSNEMHNIIKIKSIENIRLIWKRIKNYSQISFGIAQNPKTKKKKKPG